jgi:hypothetical protein
LQGNEKPQERRSTNNRVIDVAALSAGIEMPAVGPVVRDNERVALVVLGAESIDSTGQAVASA